MNDKSELFCYSSRFEPPIALLLMWKMEMEQKINAFFLEKQFYWLIIESSKTNTKIMKTKKNVFSTHRRWRWLCRWRRINFEWVKVFTASFVFSKNLVFLSSLFVILWTLFCFDCRNTHLMEEDWRVDGVHKWCRMNGVHNWWRMYGMYGMHGWNGADNWDLVDWCWVHNTPIKFKTRKTVKILMEKKLKWYSDALWQRY